MKQFFIAMGIIIILIMVSMIFWVYYTQTIEVSENGYIQNVLQGEKISNKIIINTNEIQGKENEGIPNYDFYFELPINGATGYASIKMNVFEKANSKKIIKSIEAGTPFKILTEEKNWWEIEIEETKGFVDAKYCMINLPDIIPSIIYDNTNSYSSIFKSSETAIPNITGQKLYDVYKYNKRLEKEEFIMPVIYNMAKKIMKAQKEALKQNYSLKIYETYRPYETQKAVCTNLKKLIEDNETVHNGIFGKGWSEDWFISQTISNHQRGVAMDVSLVKVKKSSIKCLGEYKYLNINDYDEEIMPTKMHELSDKATTFQYAVASSSKTKWKEVPLSKTMTDGAKKLQKYCTNAGLTPLASEWWHFNDLDAKNEIGTKYSTGKYKITELYLRKEEK